VVTAALGASPVRGAHAIAMAADLELDDVRESDYGAIVLPGGGPGSRALRDDERVLALVRSFARSNKLVAAICAAPIALEAAGVLAGRRATSYPGNELPSARYVGDRVVSDGNIVTSRGPGTALDFAFTLVERLAGADALVKVRAAMLAG
jgi:4-methyl-5(b-hydroxyethyl)-thiazole monophosphate biosynthesis